MLFHQTLLNGVLLIEPEKKEDERGFFARTCCADEFAAHGLNSQWVQSSISYNERQGTLRGMHYQAAPHEEIKLIRCTMGSIYDVVADVRPDSPTYLKWLGIELSAANRRTLYVPKGIAHGFQTLVDHSEVFYQMSTGYVPEAACGFRWDDACFHIHWPVVGARIISQRDQSYPDYALPGHALPKSACAA